MLTARAAEPGGQCDVGGRGGSWVGGVAMWSPAKPRLPENLAFHPFKISLPHIRLSGGLSFSEWSHFIPAPGYNWPLRHCPSHIWMGGASLEVVPSSGAEEAYALWVQGYRWHQEPLHGSNKSAARRENSRRAVLPTKVGDLCPKSLLMQPA